MSINRRVVLSGLAGCGVLANLPAWAQAIGRQSDPWAQVDPYADQRNGFAGQKAPSSPARRDGDGVFSSSGTGGEAALSEQDEIALGRSYYPRMIAEDGGALPNPVLQQALRDFCRPLFAVSDRPKLPWEVTLLRNAEPNAAAFAGGKVVVNAGLITYCDQAGELAAVLGHEIGHVDKRHTVRGIPVRELLAQLRANGVDSGINAQQMETLAPASGGRIEDGWDLFQKAFSREDEAEADAHMMVVLDRLGVDPAHAVRSKEVFLQMSQGSRLNELASTHPLDEKRLEQVRQLAAMQKRPKVDYEFPGWAALKTAFPTDPSYKKA